MPGPLSHVCIVIPAYNEAPRLAGVLTDVCQSDAHVIVVDDGSTDATSDCARRFRVCLVRHQTNRGQGAALRTGIAAALAAGADAVVTFDADGQHQASEIPRLLAPIGAGSADVVLGSRFLGKAPGIPATRRMLLCAGVLVTCWRTGLAVTDTHNGFRAFSRHAAQQIEIHSDGMAHASEILTEIRRLRLRFAEVPVTVTYTPETLAKGQPWYSAWTILRHLLRRPP